MEFKYLVVDVFSPEPFGGNQLAVLTDAAGLTSEGMQLVTREFNYAETTFVLPPSDPTCERQVRIFTPGAEVPFAGHPTIGTACALVMTGAYPEGPLTLQEGIGPVPVSIESRDGLLLANFTLSQAPETSDDTGSAADLAAALTLEEGEILGAFCASVGIRFTFVELQSRDAVDRARLDQAAWERHLAHRWAPQLFFFAGEPVDGGELYARMFAPGLGIAEDPATGSAVAALAGAVAARSFESGEGKLALSVTQGVRMGRTSVIEATAQASDGAVSSITIAGACAFVAEGQISVPQRYLET